MRTICLTEREVAAYWAMSALYCAEYESEESLYPDTRSNLKTYIPRIDRKVREAK